MAEDLQWKKKKYQIKKTIYEETFRLNFEYSYDIEYSYYIEIITSLDVLLVLDSPLQVRRDRVARESMQQNFTKRHGTG